MAQRLRAVVFPSTAGTAHPLARDCARLNAIAAGDGSFLPVGAGFLTMQRHGWGTKVGNDEEETE
jgi:hypothetical protein